MQMTILYRFTDKIDYYDLCVNKDCKGLKVHHTKSMAKEIMRRWNIVEDLEYAEGLQHSKARRAEEKLAISKEKLKGLVIR